MVMVIVTALAVSGFFCAVLWALIERSAARDAEAAARGAVQTIEHAFEDEDEDEDTKAARDEMCKSAMREKAVREEIERHYARQAAHWPVARDMPTEPAPDWDGLSSRPKTLIETDEGMPLDAKYLQEDAPTEPVLLVRAKSNAPQGPRNLREQVRRNFLNAGHDEETANRLLQEFGLDESDADEDGWTPEGRL